MSKKTKAYGSTLLDSNSETQNLSASAPIPEKPKLGAKQKKIIYICCVIGVSLLLSVFVCFRLYRAVSEQLLFELNIEETDLSGVEDAVYSGTYSSSHMSASVEVSIASEYIVNITLANFKSIDTARCSEVFDAVLYYQMLNMPAGDIGSEATDIIVLKAIENALNNAVSSVQPESV